MKKKQRLTKKDVQAYLKRHKLDWQLTPKGTQLSKQFLFSNYLEAFMFVARISVHAEILKHHPELTLSYGKVKAKLTTYDVKGITKLDLDLIKRIEAVFSRVSDRGQRK